MSCYRNDGRRGCREFSRRAVFLAWLVFCVSVAAAACDVIVVRGQATADGSVILVGLYQWGDSPNEPYRILHADRQTHPAESLVKLSCRYVPQVRQTWAYNYVHCRWRDEDREVPSVVQAINEWGVAIASNSLFSDEVREQEPDGMDFFDVNRLVAERARTAREGVEWIGLLLETYGYALSAKDRDDGQLWVVADPTDAWVVETVGGRHWVARRIEEDFYNGSNALTIANRFELGSDVVRYATLRGWIDGPESFHWSRDFAAPGKGWVDRYTAIRDYLAGPPVPGDIAVAATSETGTSRGPLGRVTPGTIIRMLRSAEFTRIRGFDHIQSAMIAHLRPDVPAAVRAKAYFSAGADAGERLFVPLYASDGVPLPTDPQLDTLLAPQGRRPVPHEVSSIFERWSELQGAELEQEMATAEPEMDALQRVSPNARERLRQFHDAVVRRAAALDAFVASADVSRPVAEDTIEFDLTGYVVDEATAVPLPARVYLQSETGEWLFVQSAARGGSAWPYAEQWVPMAGSVEQHTTISAHPFRARLKPGRYVVTVERGKEYFPLSADIVVERAPVKQVFGLRRWIDMAARGWYSGETHVHRRIVELPNVQLAEDLNVTFPVTFWTTKAYTPPDLEPSPLRRQGPSPFGRREDRGSAMLPIDPTHVIFPRNTEYEVFSVGDKPHVLGAMFLLNHQSVFTAGVPPVGPVAQQARREGALIDLDKHNWPWSLMLVPIAEVDLFELANNSVWRTQFGFRQSLVPPPAHIAVETDAGGMTERGWLNFGFEVYYLLLNCGFRLQPTAGTASGVHPVPLGYSRVYVQLDGAFSGPAWIEGLRRGRSFVTNGPMLLATVEERAPGHEFRQEQAESRAYRVQGEVWSAIPMDRVEVIHQGRVIASLPAANEPTPEGVFHQRFEHTVAVEQSSWIVLRCFAVDSDGRVRFAHTAPWHIQVQDQPVRPRSYEVQYLIERMEHEIQRNQGLLMDEALDEYRQALRIYRSIAERAVN